MSYQTGAYDLPNDDGFTDPVLVLVATGTHDVSRLVGLLNGAAQGAKPNGEQRRLADQVTEQLRVRDGGRVALQLLAEHGGPSLLSEVDMATTGVRVTATDLATGETGTRVIHNDVAVIAAGTCWIAHVNDFPKTGTQVITVKGRLGRNPGRARG